MSFRPNKLIGNLFYAHKVTHFSILPYIALKLINEINKFLTVSLLPTALNNKIKHLFSKDDAVSCLTILK